MTSDEAGSAPSATSSGEARRYLDFWKHVGANFPELDGAKSTAYYRRDEQWLFERFMPPLKGLRLFKTDLWDEARNTRILCWAGSRGARTFGIDLSPVTTALAAREFRAQGLRLGAGIGDVRGIPFRDGTFDAVYSMGTVEHFDETELAVEEIFRVLRPGGRAIIGVPNRHDPFLRPLLVAILDRFGMYGYGFEKSFSRKALRSLLEDAGFEILEETGILFMPGWLRMLDLACRTFAGAASTRLPHRRGRGETRQGIALRRRDHAVSPTGSCRCTSCQ